MRIGKVDSPLHVERRKKRMIKRLWEVSSALSAHPVTVIKDLSILWSLVDHLALPGFTHSSTTKVLVRLLFCGIGLVQADKFSRNSKILIRVLSQNHLAIICYFNVILRTVSVTHARLWTLAGILLS